MLVYDPINLENIPFNDYLENDTNNIVVFLKEKAYGVNKALFMFNQELKKCIIENGALLKKTTYKNPKTFYNIGYFIGKKASVNLATLNKVLEKHRVIELTSKTPGDTYINKELLKLTTINIIDKNKTNKNSKKNNFKFGMDDVYFDELMSEFLKQYSRRLYLYINKNLLDPELYNNDNNIVDYDIKNVLYYDLKAKLYYKFNTTVNNTIKYIDFKNELDRIITKIDTVFVEAAPRYEKTYNKVFYRGMKEKYINTNGTALENVGDTALILNYTSISSKYSVAKMFSQNLAKSVLYKIYLEDGLPFINMVSNTMYKDEKEYLLPRNIIFELISKQGNEYTVLAKPFKPDQFTIKTGCVSLDTYDIKPKKISHIEQKKSSSDSISKVKKFVAYSSKSKDITPVKPAKLNKCPKGMRRDKKTMKCIVKNNTKAKMQRCPKGTRRNPKTLECEAKL